MYVCMYVYVYTHTCIHTYTKHTHVHTHTHTCTHTHTHTHTHTQMCVRRLPVPRKAPGMCVCCCICVSVMHTKSTCGACGVPLRHGKGKGWAPPGCGCQAGEGDEGQQKVSRGTECRHQSPVLNSLNVRTCGTATSRRSADTELQRFVDPPLLNRV